MKHQKDKIEVDLINTFSSSLAVSIKGCLQIKKEDDNERRGGDGVRSEGQEGLWHLKILVVFVIAALEFYTFSIH